LQATPQVPGVPPPLAAVLHNLTNTLNTNHQDLTAWMNHFDLQM
jgi:hypothetical protein